MHIKLVSVEACPTYPLLCPIFPAVNHRPRCLVTLDLGPPLSSRGLVSQHAGSTQEIPLQLLSGHPLHSLEQYGVRVPRQPGAWNPPIHHRDGHRHNCDLYLYAEAPTPNVLGRWPLEVDELMRMGLPD